MGAKDYLSLFKISLLKGGWGLFLFVVWFGLLFYLPWIVKYLPPDFLKILGNIQLYIPDRKSWLVPYNILILFIWTLNFVLFKELLVRFTCYLKRGSFYHLTEQSWYKDWIYNGKVKFLQNPERLRINSSRAGCLLNRYFWKNFKMDFQMHFFYTKEIPWNSQHYEKNIGIIFRAKDLENYFLVEIIRSDGNKLYIKPHVRYQGMWDVMSEEEINYLQSGAEIPEWLTVSLEVFENRVNLYFENFGKYQLHLPTHIDINHIESGVRENQNKATKSEQEFAAKITNLPEIDFRTTYGMVGFRAHLYQGADIKNLIIKCI